MKIPKILNFKKNLEEKIEKNPINVRMFGKIPLSTIKEEYKKNHPKLSWFQLLGEIPAGDFIIVIENKGYWLSEIILANIEKRYEEVRKALFDGEKTKLKWTDINGELYPILRANKTKKQIRKYIKLPD